MNEKKNLSAAGHRQRVKKRFQDEGLENFAEAHVLELLLFYAIAQIDTKPIAKELIARFGSFSQVLDATRDELKKVEGIGDNAATFLNLITEVGRYYLVNKEANAKILTTIEDCARYLVPRFHHLRDETVLLLCLDGKRKLLCCREVGQGNVNSAAISSRRIAEIALGVNASAVVLAHNHPSGLALPSGDDVATTERIGRALAAVDVILADHIIVADEDYVSLVQSGCYTPSR